MKVVVCNYRYFVTGGPERYMFSLFDLLQNKGHKVIPFSVAYTQNRATEYSKYFVSPPGNPEQVYFKEMQLSLSEKVRAAINVIYSSEARKKLERLIRDEKPSVIQTLQIHTVLSFSLVDAAKKYGVPVVSRMSNYQLMCPAEHFLRDNIICEECNKSLFNSIKYKCVQKSLPASALRAASLWYHRLRKTFKKIDHFIVPSNFLRTKMIESGFSEDRVTYVPSFLNINDFEPSYESDGYIAYAGRIAIEKGVPNLVKAFSKVKTDKKLLIIGNYENPEGVKVRRYIENYNIKNIEFLGYRPLLEIKEILKKAMFTICPSIWYENSPNSIYESFALGKPVLGTRIGSIEEQIEDNKTGLLFEPDNVDDLADKIDYFVNNKSLLIEMGKEARKVVEQKHSPEVHYNKLMDVYNKLI